MTTPRRVQLHRRVGVSWRTSTGRRPERTCRDGAPLLRGSPGRGRRPGGRAMRERAGDRAARAACLSRRPLASTSRPSSLDLKPAGGRSGALRAAPGLGEAQARAGRRVSEPRHSSWPRSSRARRALEEELARAALGYGGSFVWMVGGFDEKDLPLLEDALWSSVSSTRARCEPRFSRGWPVALRDQPQPERRTRLPRRRSSIARRLEDRSALAYALDGQYATSGRRTTSRSGSLSSTNSFGSSDEVGDGEREVPGPLLPRLRAPRARAS